MEIFTSFVNNYKQSMSGLHLAAQVLLTTMFAMTLLGISGAVVNLFINTI